MPKVSIIVPIYNTVQYLNICIESILQQTYADFELILVDDGSTDGSDALCDQVNDARVKVIHQKNQGVSAARNTGLKKAVGQYIMFVDSDDTIEPNMLECLYNNALKKNADIIICGAVPKSNKDLFTTLALQEQWGPWNKLIKKSTLHHTFDPSISIGEDLLFIYQNHKYWKTFVFILEEFYHYRIHRNSVMQHTTISQNDLSSLDVILEIIDDDSLSQELHLFFQSYYIKTFYYLFARVKYTQLWSQRRKYAEYLPTFYHNICEHHLITPKVFLQHRVTWLYNILQRIKHK